MIVGDHMFIDFVDVEIVDSPIFLTKFFCVNKINKHLNSDDYFGIKCSRGVGQSFRDGGSIVVPNVKIVWDSQ
jgi:hypothetical protein